MFKKIAQLKQVEKGTTETLQGAIDGFALGVASGWVATTENDRSVNVDIFCNGKIVGSGCANVFRDDLKQNGLHSGEHGFRIPITCRWPTETDEVELTLVDADTSQKIQAATKKIQPATRKIQIQTHGMRSEIIKNEHGFIVTKLTSQYSLGKKTLELFHKDKHVSLFELETDATEIEIRHPVPFELQDEGCELFKVGITMMHDELINDIKLIEESKLFEQRLYEESVAITFESERDAIKDYLSNNINYDKKASIFFDHDFYLEKNKDVKKLGLNPLAHFLRLGAKELRDPSIVFKSEYYLSQLSPEQKKVAKVNPLIHYMGNQSLARPNALFDKDFYCSQLNVDVQYPFSHYLEYGFKQGLDPHPLFCSKFFLESFDVDENISPLAAYCDMPANLRVQVHPLFDSKYYSERHPEVKPSGLDSLSHYIIEGSFNNYWPMPLFMSEYYRNQLGNSDEKYDTLLTHYVLEGEFSGISPCPWFDRDFYLDSYKFVLKDSRGALAHYFHDGWKHDFMPSELFPPRLLKSRYGYSDHVNPLAHYVRTSPGMPTLPQRAWNDTVPEYKQLEIVKSFFGEELQKRPTVSIIIPVYNNFSYTLRCLYSIAISRDKCDYEVIIADDQSIDETKTVLSVIPGIKYIRNKTNLGFLRSCNNAAKQANGKYIFLLNNDTAVLDGWIDSLVETFDCNESVGLVGSKLLYPNGLLQESGGVLWSNGAANVGKFDDPDHPSYSYMRLADYISGAAIMLPKQLWDMVGGFDDQFAPAYCEDSDLCLQLRNMGYKVLMQPASKLVHFEGISSGTDLSSGVKKYQVINSEKLRDKWQGLLSQNGSQGDFDRGCVDRANGSRVLVIDAMIPTPDQDAGSVTALYFLKIFKQLGYQVTFIPKNLHNTIPYSGVLGKLGVECLFKPYLNDIDDYIRESGHLFDVVMLYRVNCGGEFFESVRRFAPRAKVIFDTVDLHFLRQEREAKMEKNKKKSAKMLAESSATRNRELHLLRQSDISIVLSDYEKSMLAGDWGIDNTVVIPIVLEVPGRAKPYSERRDIAFIGGYQHTPNVDAVLYFVESLWPKIKEEIEGVKFYVIGSKPTAEILELQENDKDIIVTGFVETLDPYMDRLRLTVAPLRYGAGIKGKIGSSLSYGVPCVATKVAAEGMGLEHGVNILMHDDESSFVDNLVEIYSEPEKWELLSDAGMEFVKENYSIDETRDRLLHLFNSVGAAPFQGFNPFTGNDDAMRLAAKPHTDKLLCETFGSTVSHRLLATSVLEEAKVFGLEKKSYPDAVKLLAGKGLCLIAYSGNFPDYMLTSPSTLTNVTPAYGLIELELHNGEIDYQPKLEDWLGSEHITLLGVVKGEQITEIQRNLALNTLYSFCQKYSLDYHVFHQESGYPGQRHIRFKISRLISGTNNE